MIPPPAPEAFRTAAPDDPAGNAPAVLGLRVPAVLGRGGRRRRSHAKTEKMFLPCFPF